MIAVAMQIKIDMTTSCLRLIIIDLNKDCVKVYLLSLRYEKRVSFKTQSTDLDVNKQEKWLSVMKNALTNFIR